MAIVNSRAAIEPKTGKAAIFVNETIHSLIRKLFANNEQGFFYDPNDLSTMFQDAAGTIPVTGVGQAVGLILDKSKGLLKTELIRDVGFDNPLNWPVQPTGTTGVAITNGMLVCNSASNDRVVQSTTTISANTRYTVEIDIVSYVRGEPFILCGGVEVPLPRSVGRHTISFITTTASTFIGVYSGKNAIGGVWSASSISVTRIEGNHAYQTQSSMRPLLKQRPSELVINGDFGNGITGWTQSGTATVTVSGGILTVQANGATSGVYQDFTVKPNTKYRLSLTTVSALSRVAVYGNWAFSPMMGSATAGVLEFTPTSDKIRMYLYCNGTDVGTFDNVSLRKVVEDSYISNAISFDTIDDKLTTTLPAQLTGCTVVRAVPNVGTQILTGQTIPTPYNDNKDHCGLIVINRALTATETSQITKLFNKAAGV